jgi:hypothetical protein
MSDYQHNRTGVRDCVFENNFFYPADGKWTDEKKAEFLAWRERCGKDDWRYNDPLPWVDDRAVKDFTRVCEQTGLIDKLRKE